MITETHNTLDGKKTPNRAASGKPFIENPVTGERLTFLATTEDTHGELVKIKNEIPAGAPGVPMHYHPSFTESFDLLEGALDGHIGKYNHFVHSDGRSAFVSPNTPHRCWNRGAGLVVFVGDPASTQSARVQCLGTYLDAHRRARALR